MKSQHRIRRGTTLLACFICSFSGEKTAAADAPAPCAHYHAEKQPFFGDLHVHTKYSLDAATQGTQTTPDQAYRFAKGERLQLVQGVAQIGRPLDFAMVADHAELLGEVSLCSNPNSSHYHAWQCSLYRGWPRGAYYWFNFWSSIFAQRVGFCSDATTAPSALGADVCATASLGPWRAIQRAAEDHNDPESCRFTTFVGYEWTGGSVDGEYGNIHRNLVFRNANVPELPVSFIEANSAAALFDHLDAACPADDGADEACEAVVIPHNSNLSAGLMFPNAPSSAMLPQRARYEVLAEIMQHKGSSECYFNREKPLGNADEYCAFEALSVRSFTDSGPAEPTDGFLRDVLKTGLSLERQSGINPYQFGFIGSTDTHLGTPGLVSEQSFIGHGGAGKPANRVNAPSGRKDAGLPDLVDYNPGGLAVLWAEENRRDALFDAMKRREAYATSGPRLTVRMFGGPNISTAMCEAADFGRSGYRDGVAMGANVRNAGAAEHKPGVMRIALQALQDPNSVGLEQLQIVKGWVDRQGKAHEKVVGVAQSTSSHELDVQTCEVRGTSATKLCAVWQDPDFEATEHSYYYGRVLEGPTCRWSQRACIARGVRCDDPSTRVEGYEGCCAPGHRAQINERAWTSPIWYSPSAFAQP